MPQPVAVALGGDLVQITGLLFIAVFGVAVFYEGLRSRGPRTDRVFRTGSVNVLIWITVGTGYAIRGVAGLFLAGVRPELEQPRYDGAGATGWYTWFRHQSLMSLKAGLRPIIVLAGRAIRAVGVAIAGQRTASLLDHLRKRARVVREEGQLRTPAAAT